jgi:hypothetical protein
MEEKVDDSVATATGPTTSSSLRDFFEKAEDRRGAAASENSRRGVDRTSSGISSKTSSSCSAENWANFELVTISASSTISFDCQPASFVVFESSWHAWLLGGNRSFNNNVSTISSVPVEDDDGWMSQLLPLRHQHTKTSNHRSTRKIPPLQRNPRDCTIHHRFHADSGLFDHSTSHYHHYQAAYSANVNAMEDNNLDPVSGEHLSNEEWIAQRRRRDGRLRRRYQQEVEHMLGLEQVIVSSSPEDVSNRANLDQQRFVRRIVADGQILLSMDTQSENNASIGTLQTNRSIPEHEILGTEAISTSIVDPSSTTLSPQVRPRQRFRARRAPVTSQARRELFQHWSSSAVQRSLDVVLVPWRMVFRNDGDPNSVEVPSADHNWSMLELTDDVDRSISDDLSGRAISSEANSISLEDEAVHELPPWPSGRGWQWGQDDESQGSADDDYQDSDESTGGTGYWSTGTAMETYYSSSSSASSAVYQDDRGAEEWVDGLAQRFPSLEEEDPLQYEFMPTPEDPLFPDDPFPENI